MKDDYKCNDCEYMFEFSKPYKEEWPKNPECPECKSTKTERVFTKRNLHVPEHMRSSFNGR